MLQVSCGCPILCVYSECLAFMRMACVCNMCKQIPYQEVVNTCSDILMLIITQIACPVRQWPALVIPSLRCQPFYTPSSQHMLILIQHHFGCFLLFALVADSSARCSCAMCQECQRKFINEPVPHGILCVFH